MAKGTILVVDDEKEIRDLIDIYLKHKGYHVLKASDSRMALGVLLSFGFSCVRITQ